MSIEESVENPKFLASNSIWCIQATFIQLKGPTSYGSFFKNPQGGPKRCQITDLEVGEWLTHCQTCGPGIEWFLLDLQLLLKENMNGRQKDLDGGWFHNVPYPLILIIVLMKVDQITLEPHTFQQVPFLQQFLTWYVHDKTCCVESMNQRGSSSSSMGLVSASWKRSWWLSPCRPSEPIKKNEQQNAWRKFILANTQNLSHST